MTQEKLPHRKELCLQSEAHLPQVRFFSASIATLLSHEEVSRICNIQKNAHSPLTAGHASAGTGEYEKQNGTAKEQYGVDDGSPRTCRGLITADIPRINRMLNRLEPMALPSASPLSPFSWQRWRSPAQAGRCRWR